MPKTTKTTTAKKSNPKTTTPRKKAVKKTVKKVVKKAKKSTATKTPRTKKEGLRKPQIRILQCLAKSKHPLSRKEISETAPADLACLTSWIGSHDETIRAKNDKLSMPSLLTLKAVKFGPPTEASEVVYEITALGRKMIENL
jgi:hypothetical protein